MMNLMIPIAERERYIEELRAENAKLRTAAENFIVLVDLCDLHGPAIQCREASNELAKAIGFTLKDRVARQSALKGESE